VSLTLASTLSIPGHVCRARPAAPGPPAFDRAPIACRRDGAEGRADALPSP